VSLAIDAAKVVAVLLADGWHPTLRDSFRIDTYEFVHDAEIVLKAGQSPPTSTMGFTFTEAGTDRTIEISGPLASVLAVKSRK
jgi:hypothetical protein